MRSSDVVQPVYYPHSPRARRDSAPSGSEVDRLLDQFLHLHTAMRYEDALEVAEGLIELLPESAVMHYNHACVLGRLMRTDRAIDALERAIELGWRNLSHLRIDPDLHAIRWSERYEDISERLAAKIRREQPIPGPLRKEAWETIVRDIKAVMPNLMVSNHVSAVTISLVQDGKHVWTGAFAASAVTAGEGDEQLETMPPDPQQSFVVEGPAQLLAMLGVLERWEGHGEPGVLRLVELCRHAVRGELASMGGARPVARRSLGGHDRDDAGAFAQEQHRSPNRNRRVIGDRVWRISHVPDDVHDLLRMAVEHLSGDNFIRYCHERAFPSIGMAESDLVIVGGRDGRGMRHVARDTRHQQQHQGGVERQQHDWNGAPRPVVRTTADDLAAIITHALAMERSPREQTMDWHQICDHLLRSCVTRGLSIGSSISIQRTPFGLRTDVVSVGGGSGCVMRWYPQSGSGVAILFNDDSEGSGQRTAERLAHLALGGDP